MIQWFLIFGVVKVYIKYGTEWILNFSNFTMPTLIMTGENEIGSTPEMSTMLGKQINSSKIYIIPKAKHLASFEKADLVNIKISKFIS